MLENHIIMTKHIVNKFFIDVRNELVHQPELNKHFIQTNWNEAFQNTLGRISEFQELQNYNVSLLILDYTLNAIIDNINLLPKVELSNLLKIAEEHLEDFLSYYEKILGSLKSNSQDITLLNEKLVSETFFQFVEVIEDRFENYDFDHATQEFENKIYNEVKDYIRPNNNNRVLVTD